jgi:WD40 repeat protein
MKKKQFFSVTLIIIFLSVVMKMPGVLASPDHQELTITASSTTTLIQSPTPENGISEKSTFGEAELQGIFPSGDQKKLFIALDNELEHYDSSTNEFIDKYVLSNELDNSILGVNDDGELVALKAKTGFYIYNTKTKLQSPPYENSYEGYTFYSFFPDGKAFLFGVHHPSMEGSTTDLLLRGVDGNNNILSRDFAPPIDAQLFYGYTSPVISSDGIYLAAGFSDQASHRILVWKTNSNDIFYEIQNMPAEITSLDISPDSETIASAGKDGIIRFWNMQTGESIKEISGFDSPISRINFVEKGKGLSIFTENHRIYSYSISANQLKEVPKSDDIEHSLLLQKINEGHILTSVDQEKINPKPASLVFSPDGNKIALIEGSIQIWHVHDQLLYTSFVPDTRLRFTSAVFDPKSERLAILSDLGDVYVWNFVSNKIVLHIPHQEMLENQQPFTADNVSNAVDQNLTDYSQQNIVFSPDGTQIAFANGMNIEIWNISMGAKLRTLSAEGILGRPEKLVYSDDGKSIIAVCNTDEYFVTWNIDDQEVTNQYKLIHNADTHGKTTSLGKSTFITLNNNGTDSWISSFDLNTQESQSSPLLNNTLFSSAFNFTGTLFASIDNATNLYLWRTDNTQLLYYEKGFSINSTLAINPSGTILATTENGRITFWDIASITEMGFKDNFVSPTLIPAENGGFTFAHIPTATPEQKMALTPTQPPQEISPDLPEGTQEVEITENTENSGTILLKAQQNAGIINTVKWQNNKVFLSSTSGLYSYDRTKDEITIIFTNEEMDISSIEGYSNANYLSAGTTAIDQIQLWNQKKLEKQLSTRGLSAPVISPDKKWIAYDLGDSRLMIWNVSNQQSEFIISSNKPSTSPVFSPDSKHLAIAQGNGLIQIWNTSQGTIEYAGNSSYIPCSDIHFSHDGKLLIGIAGGSAWIWPFTTNDPPIEIEVYADRTTTQGSYLENFVTAADINFDNEIIAIGDDTGTIRFYTVEDQNLFKNLTQAKFEIEHLSFSPKDNLLLSVDINGDITIWDADSSELLNEVKYFTGSYNGLQKLDDGNIAAWTQNRIIVYDPSTLEAENEITIDANKLLDVSPNGNWAAAYIPYSIALFDLSTGTNSTTLKPEAEIITVDRDDNDLKKQTFFGAAFSADSQYLITYGTGGAWVYQLGQNDVRKTSLLGHISNDQIRIAAINNDGSQFILSTGEGYLRPKIYESIKNTELMEVPLAEYQTNLIGGQEYSAYLFSPDDQSVILLRSGLYPDARLEIFDMVSGKMNNFLRFPDTTADALAVNSDGTRIAIGFRNGEVNLYDAETLTLMDTFVAHTGSVTHLAFSTDGKLLISSGSEGAMKSWILH